MLSSQLGIWRTRSQILWSYSLGERTIGGPANVFSQTTSMKVIRRSFLPGTIPNIRYVRESHSPKLPKLTKLIKVKIQLPLSLFCFATFQLFLFFSNNDHIPVHSLGATHSLMVSSITVPFGHSHPLVIQMRGQARGPVVLHVWWQPGCEAHSFLTCPLMGQTASKYSYVHNHSTYKNSF